MDEAVYSWVIPEEAVRRERVVSAADDLAAWVEGMYHSGEVVVACDDSDRIVGVSFWEFVDGDETGSEVESAEAAAFIEQAYGEYAPRMTLVHELIGKRHPRHERHWYLCSMVVVPAQRGRGFGGAMLRYQLARTDEAGVGAYLEASTPRNRMLYERHGFRDSGEPIKLPDGPSLQPMWRPAERSHSVAQ